MENRAVYEFIFQPEPWSGTPRLLIAFGFLLLLLLMSGLFFLGKAWMGLWRGTDNHVIRRTGCKLLAGLFIFHGAWLTALCFVNRFETLVWGVALYVAVTSLLFSILLRFWVPGFFKWKPMEDEEFSRGGAEAQGRSG